MAIYYGDPVTALTLLGRASIAERIATLTALLDRSPAAVRRSLVATMNATDKWVSLEGRSPPAGGEARDWESRLLKDVLAKHLGGVDASRIHVGYRSSAPDTKASRAVRASGATTETAKPRANIDQEPATDPLHVSIELEDGTWLTFETPELVPRLYFSIRFILSMSIMAVTVIIAAFWAVRRLTAPLTTFAAAAERLGVDVGAPQLPETGPAEVRKATRAFNEMQRRLRRFVEDRTLMVASISHDLRTPITRLRLRAEFVEDAEQQGKMLADLDEMERMINSTLSFAREDAETEARETVDLVALLHSLCDDLSDAGQPVAFNGEGRLPYRCRPIGLRRVLGNLIDNALKYGQKARVTLAEEAGKIVLRIDDDGPGIPEGRIEEVFRPFHRLEESRNRETGGTGLGLTVARSIVRAHGGELGLVNRPEGGLRTEVSLPL
jgi:signal transduction histidine kinase